MTSFWIAAAALGIVALAFVLVPLWRRRERDGRWSGVGLTAALAMVPLSVGLYLTVSNWIPETSGGGALPPVAEMVKTLERRMQEHPEDPAGWSLLGRSYMSLGRYAEAQRAFREAWTRTRVPDSDLKLSLGEAEVLTNRDALRGEAGRLFDEVLEAEPNNPKALWYGGLAALEMQKQDLAKERWTRLLSLDPPEAVARVLHEQLGLLGAPATPAALAQTPPPATPGGAASPTSTGTGPTIRLRVRLGDDVSTSEMGAQAALFIFARAPGGGPPLAVIRQPVSALPGVFSLSDANAMIPGRSLADFQTISLVARVSANGQPVGQPGDLYGEVEYHPGQDPADVDLVVDQVQQ